jgi:hypothetical protein
VAAFAQRSEAAAVHVVSFVTIDATP